MKSSILHEYLDVETQTKPTNNPHLHPPTNGSSPHSDPVAAASFTVDLLAAHPPATRASTLRILGSPNALPSAPRLTLFVGLDVHNESIAVSLAPSDSTEVRRYGLIGGSQDDVLRLYKKLQAAHPGWDIKFCYEAGPHGFPLRRFLQTHGVFCIIVAPSKVPRKPGDRVKTDRRDADQLARLYRAGELQGIYVPDPQDEAVRDLLRGRHQISTQQHRARQQLKMFLLRHNRRYSGTKAWTTQHLRWLATVKLPFPEQQFVFQEMIHVINDAAHRLERYDAHLPSVVAGWRWEPVVLALMGMRGVRLYTATVLVAELGDLHRFEHPSQLMSYLGLVPSEDTSGDDRRQGGLTKMGNGYARRALIEAAWHYVRPPRISRGLLARQEGLPKHVTDTSWKAQLRLHDRFNHLRLRGRKKSQVAAAAVARELAGFIWAIARSVKPHEPKPSQAKPGAAQPPEPKPQETKTPKVPTPPSQPRCAKSQKPNLQDPAPRDAKTSEAKAPGPRTPEPKARARKALASTTPKPKARPAKARALPL